MRVYKNELYHYGVKGMKWGIRKDEDVPASESKRYDDFYDRSKRFDRMYSDTRTPKGGRRSIRDDLVTTNYYKNQSSAIESYFLRNHLSVPDPGAIYVRTSDWVKAPIYANTRTGHWLSDGSSYLASDVPDAYRQAVLNPNDYNAKEYQAIINANYLITDDLIDETERLGIYKLYDYQRELDLSGESLVSMINGQEGPVGTSFSYKQAVINGNNAIDLQRTANALKAAKKEQRSDPVKFVKALSNEVARTVGSASKNIFDAGKSFISNLFKKK